MKMKNVSGAKAVENFPGVLRRTLSYNDEAMLCHFTLEKSSGLPLHNHRATQIGFILRGKIRFLAEEPEDEFEAEPGHSYVFSRFVIHGLTALEESEYIEVFVPVRDEYKDF